MKMHSLSPPKSFVVENIPGADANHIAYDSFSIDGLDASPGGGGSGGGLAGHKPNC